MLWAVSIPFVSAFSPHPWAPICLLVPALLGLILLPIRFGNFLNGYSRGDVLLIGVVALGFIGWLWAPSHSRRALNHGLAISVSVILFYFIQRNVLIREVGFDRLCRALCISLILSSAFIISEFLLANLSGYQMRDFIPYLEIRLAEIQIEESIMMQRWIRPRGFAFEAGHMATFYELALPLSMVHTSRWSKVSRAAFYTLCVGAFLLLASAAGIFALLCALVIIFLRGDVSGRAKVAVLSLFLLVSGLVMTSSAAREYAWGLVFGKVSGFVGLRGSEGYSAEDRSARALAAVDIAQRFPLGVGWGTAAALSMEGGGLGDLPFGFISFYAEVLVAGGWLALVLWLLFVFYSIYTGWHQRDPKMTAALVAAVSISIHYITISNFWFPVMWLSYAVVHHLRLNAKHPKPLLSKSIRLSSRSAV